jgi:hypothetical protein
MIILATILLAVLSAFAYRLGGLSKEQAKQQIPWCPSWLINSKTRDIGCSLIVIGWMLMFYPHVAWYWYLLSFGAMWGALSTYWDFINGEDNFWLHGFGIGLALLPIAIGSGHWFGFGVRAVALAVLVGTWCAIFKNDWVEECGRGAFIVLTLPILLI